MKGGVFLDYYRGEKALEIREGVKIENRSKAVNALSFIFTVSVLNSCLCYRDLILLLMFMDVWLKLLLTWIDIDVHECMDERWFEVSIVTSIIYFVYSHRTCVKTIKNRTQILFYFILFIFSYFSVKSNNGYHTTPS